MRKIRISQDIEAYELDGLLFWFHVDAEIHIETDDQDQSDSRVYYADISNGCYALNQPAADLGEYSDMTTEQVKAVSRSLDVEHFRLF
jgi:hypothetical protein